MTMLRDLRKWLDDQLSFDVYVPPLPQGVDGAVAMLSRQTAERDYTFDGPSGLRTMTVQADCWGSDVQTSEDALEDLTPLLVGHAVTVGDYTVQEFRLLDDGVGPLYEEEVRLYRTSAVFQVWYWEG